MNILMNDILPLLLATGLVAVMMAGVSVWSSKHCNAGLVDVVWGYSFGCVCLLYALLGQGHWIHKTLITFMVGLASLRLGSHLLRRLKHDYPVEDVRYQDLRKHWLANYSPTVVSLLFMGVYFGQGVLIVLLSIGMLAICNNPSPTLHWVEWLGGVVWLLGFVIEAMADEQLYRFKQANPTQLCMVGLWRYSRHPNYFGQWLLWVGYALVACALPWGWLYGIAPILMFYFLTKCTGIALSEAKSIERRGEAYRAYQLSTSAFFPFASKPKGVAQ
jgi:steroid 5-alpha reductase family enzyme